MSIIALRINKPPITVFHKSGSVRLYGFYNNPMSPLFQFSNLLLTQLMQLSDYFTNTDNCQKSKLDKPFN